MVSGGFPCQDISAAGTGEGLDGARSGLWVEMARIISEVRPTFCFVENSPMLTVRGLGRVLGDLAAMGYDAEWGVLGAVDVGAPHQRDRIWIVAYTSGEQYEGAPHAGSGQGQGEIGAELFDVADSYEIGRNWRAGMLRQGWRVDLENCGDEVADTDSQRLEELNAAAFPSEARQYTGGIAAFWRENWWTVEPGMGRVAHGVAARVDRLQALGNGQVPRCHAEAWLRLSARFGL